VCCGSSSEKHATHCKCALPYCKPTRRKSHFSVVDKGLFNVSAQGAFAKDRDEQFFLLVGSYLTGTHVLAFFGISLPVVQVGGGLIVISTGWTMLKRPDDDEEERDEIHRNVQPQDTFRNAFYPLTLPLTVGPGSISVAITLGANAPYHYGVHYMVILAAIVGSLVIAVSIFLCYGFADRLAQILGERAMSVIMGLFTFLLLCIGVQILWNGTSQLLASVPLHVR
jgi:multiple antibiotic resistance protein